MAGKLSAAFKGNQETQVVVPTYILQKLGMFFLNSRLK